MNAALKVQAVGEGNWPAPGGYLEALAKLPFGGGAIAQLAVDLFALDDDCAGLTDAHQHLLHSAQAHS
jgi:hypothetical protein